MALFEGYERKIDKINGVLAQYGLESVEACREMCVAKGFDPYDQYAPPRVKVKTVQVLRT